MPNTMSTGMPDTMPKTMLITGAGRGIGRALALKLAPSGVNLILASRTYHEIEAVAEEAIKAGANARAVLADVTDPREVNNLVLEAKQAYGGVDMVYHGAGVGVLGSALELKDADLDRMLDTNLKALFYLTRATIPLMLSAGSGQFVIPVGILGRYAMRNSAGYSASKFAVVGLVKALGEEFNKKNIRFTMLYLGGVNTSFWDTIEMKVDRTRMLTPESVADTVIYALNAPGAAIVNEIVMQPDSHQFI